MSRKKQKTMAQRNGDRSFQEDNQQRQFENYVPEMQLARNGHLADIPDSLQRFQWQLQNSLKYQRVERMEKSKYPRKVKRHLTQINESESSQQQIDHKTYKKLSSLKEQLGDIKTQLKNMSHTPRMDDRLDKLLEEMIKSRQLDRELFKKQQTSNSSVPNNYFYPPMPQMPFMGYPPYPQYPPQQQQPQQQQLDKKYQNTKSTFLPKKVNRARRRLKKYFFAVLFIKFLNSQAKKLAKTRKNNFRKFYTQKFNSQMLNLKNWLVEANGYAFPVILQKQSLSLQFWNQKRNMIQKEKRVLLLKIVLLGLQKMKKDCVPMKVSLFSEILQSLCGRGSFIMSRFWSAVQMQNICISQYYGCIRAEQSLQKFLIGMVIFIKVLIFNMFLQPYKFDRTNFSKKNQNLMRNMYIIASVYYRAIKQVLQEYLYEERPKYYKLGNWLNVNEEFIIQCCEPLLFNCDYAQENEWITGMLGDELQILQMQEDWSTIKSRMQDIIQYLHEEMIKRRKEVIKKQKYNIYH